MIGKQLARVVVSLTLCFAGAPGSAIAAPADDGDGFLLNPGGWWGPIYRMEPSGKIEPLELSMVPDREAGFHQPGRPVISPDQRWIAFTRENDLWLSAVERGETLRLDEAENLSHFLMIEHVAWLDSATFLVKSSAPADTTEFPVEPREVGRFSSSYPNPTHYFRVSSDGKKFAFVAGFEGTASQEDVSPDGKRMVVHSHTAGDSGGRSVSRLWTVELENGDVAPLTDESSWHHDHQIPRFSPDGNSVAYECTRTRCANEECSRREQRHYLKVEGKIVAHCTLGGMRYEWIDNRTVAADCDRFLGVVDIRTSEVLHKIEVPQPED